MTSTFTQLQDLVLFKKFNITEIIFTAQLANLNNFTFEESLKLLNKGVKRYEWKETVHLLIVILSIAYL